MNDFFLTSLLDKMAYFRILLNPCVYYNKDITHLDKVQIDTWHVDDGIIYSTNVEKLKDIPQYLDKVFKKYRGDMGYYIGLEVYQSQLTSITFLHQHW